MGDKAGDVAYGVGVKGFFGGAFIGLIYGIMALIKGAMHLNEKEDACPWSPELIDFLLTYGIINVLLPVFCIVMVLVAFCLRETVGTSIVGYIPGVSYVIGFGLAMWGFVLLYSNPDSVTYIPNNANSMILNENYCDQLVHTFSMVISYWYVIMVLLIILFFIIRSAQFI